MEIYQWFICPVKNALILESCETHSNPTITSQPQDGVCPCRALIKFAVIMIWLEADQGNKKG